MNLLKSVSIAVLLTLGATTASQAEALPKACIEGQTVIAKITNVDAGDGYYLDMNTKDGYISAYCDVGDCEVLYDNGISNVLAKVTLSTLQMEEHIESVMCSVTDIELNPL